MSDCSAAAPFRFVSCMELRESLGKRAQDVERLLEIIEEAPADSMYYHTHSYYLRHPYTQELYPNDFANWVARHARDRVLGERLGVVDPFDFNDIEAVRAELVGIIGDHLDHTRGAVSTRGAEPFEFIRSHVIDVDLCIEVATLQEFRDELSRVEVGAVLDRLEIPPDKPLLVQISRFDRFKDPVGVVEAYRIVKKSHDCRLVLAGGSADDDPGGAEILAEVREAVGVDSDAHLLLLHPTANIEINALQRAATIVLQKSTREGFGLTVTEAMWKGKPVIGGETGGITAQVIHGETGYTVNSPEGAAFYIKHLLNDVELMAAIGRQAKEYVRHRFLITRQLQDYLGMMIHLSRQAA